MSMHVPDFRAAERTYQLLEQVAGRAGRGSKPGRVVIQTYWADHPAVTAVATGDASRLYGLEAADRRALGFPPFGRIVNLIVYGPKATDVAGAASALVAAFGDLPAGWSLVGPAPAPIAKLKGNWRWHVLLKAPAGAAVPAVVQRALASMAIPADVTLVVDVDPVGML
jgi:primosomal protein N' (replication factor Y)